MVRLVNFLLVVMCVGFSGACGDDTSGGAGAGNGDSVAAGDGDAVADGDGDGDAVAAGDGDGAVDKSVGDGGPAVDAGASDAADDKGRTCVELCELVVAPGCADGPPAASLCALLCEGSLMGTNVTCRDAFRGLLDCVDADTEFSCDDADNLVPTNCVEEYATLKPCLPSL